MRCGQYLPDVRHTCHRYTRNYLLSTSRFAFSRLHHWFIYIQLHSTHLQGSLSPFFLTAHHTLVSQICSARQFDGCSPETSGPSEGLSNGCPIVLHPFQSIQPQGADSSHTRDSAWRRRAFGDVLFQPTPNFLKILNFLFTLNRPLYPM
jgi:hypothetical protein